MPLNGVNRSTLREQVYQRLRGSILDGTLAPGSRLTEIELSDQLGVSRGTIREALRYLQQAKLVEGQDRTGLRVTELTPYQIFELYQTRAALEGTAAAVVATHENASELIDKLEANLPYSPEGASVAERMQSDLHFHELLCELSGNSYLLDMWRTLKDIIWVGILSVSDAEKAELMHPDFHRSLIVGLRSGDAETARLAMITHLAQAAKRWARDDADGTGDGGLVA